MIDVGLIGLLVYWLTATPVLSSPQHAEFRASAKDQQSLAPDTLTSSRNYSVGFSLSSSYGAAAVIIDDAHDEPKTLTWFVQGDETHREVMARLSMWSSQHLAPPYEDMGEYFQDRPRVMLRAAQKKLGLPASFDVWALSTVIKTLKTQIESDLRITVEDGTLTTTHLHALYKDDVQDICEYAGFRYIIPDHLFRNILWETSSAYAGYGYGLCEHWQDEEQCQTEKGELPDRSVLAVHYSKTALTSTLAEIQSALGTWDPAYRRVENFRLGSDAMSRYQNEDDYWSDVKRNVLKILKYYPTMKRPEKILLTGDMVTTGGFMHMLEGALKDTLGEVPDIISDDDAAVVAAKGAAELRRRGAAPWTP